MVCGFGFEILHEVYAEPAEVFRMTEFRLPTDCHSDDVRRKNLRNEAIKTYGSIKSNGLAYSEFWLVKI
jgi:hypothetical protein